MWWCRSNLVQGLLEFWLDCSPDLAISSNVGSDLSNPSKHTIWSLNFSFHEEIFALFSMVETSRALNRYRQYFRLNILWSVNCCYWKGRFSALQVQCRYDWLFHKWNWGSCIAHCQYAQAVVSITKFLRTTGSLPCAIIVATVVVASEANLIASFFEKSLCKNLLYRLPQWGALQVLILQSFDSWPGLKQLKRNLNFCICSCRSFSFLDLHFLQLQMAWCSSLLWHSEFFRFVELSALESKTLGFGFLRL